MAYSVVGKQGFRPYNAHALANAMGQHAVQRFGVCKLNVPIDYQHILGSALRKAQICHGGPVVGALVGNNPSAVLPHQMLSVHRNITGGFLIHHHIYRRVARHHALLDRGKASVEQRCIVTGKHNHRKGRRLIGHSIADGIEAIGDIGKNQSIDAITTQVVGKYLPPRAERLFFTTRADPVGIGGNRGSVLNVIQDFVDSLYTFCLSSCLQHQIVVE